MYPRGVSSEVWIELMWSFLWILMIPVAMTLILLTLTILAAIGRTMNDAPISSYNSFKKIFDFFGK